MTVVNVLIIDDDVQQCRTLTDICASLGYKVDRDTNYWIGIKKIVSDRFDIIFCNIDSPRFEVKLFSETVRKCSDTGFIFLTSEDKRSNIHGLTKGGIYDYILKPLHYEEVKIISKRTIDKVKRRLSQNLIGGSKVQESQSHEFSEIIGESKCIKDLFRIVKKIAGSKSTVLITGETGTGKELFARAIHKSSSRSDKPFIPVDCAAIPHELLESEFFGHVKGAFTHAIDNKIGLFEKANGGTLFLDEIGDLPFGLQVKILRTIQEEEIRRVGGSNSIKLDIRIITATNKNLEEEVKQKRFREDLFYRLNVIHLQIPPLRERKEDIPLLVKHFIKKFAKKNKRNVKGIYPNALAMLTNYNWPGNVRELENTIEQTVLLTENEYIVESDLPEFLERRRFEVRDRFRRESIEKKLSIEAYTRSFVERFQDELTEKELAKCLGITTKTLWEKRQKWDMPRSRWKKTKQQNVSHQLSYC